MEIVMRKRIPIETETLLRRASAIPKFTVEQLDRFATDVARGRIPMKNHEMYIPDPENRGTGLKASVLKSGNWSFKVEYTVKKEPGRRFYLTIGRPPEVTVERARSIARKVAEIKKLPDVTGDMVRNIVEIDKRLKS